MNVGTPAVLAHSWLLLIHQLPAKPAYLRVKIWRRLQGIGAVAVKNAVHVLPMQVIVGVSAPGFAPMRSLAKASMDAGAAGVMHFWANDDALKLARGLRAAIDKTASAKS